MCRGDECIPAGAFAHFGSVHPVFQRYDIPGTPFMDSTHETSGHLHSFEALFSILLLGKEDEGSPELRVRNPL